MFAGKLCQDSGMSWASPKRGVLLLFVAKASTVTTAWRYMDYLAGDNLVLATCFQAHQGIPILVYISMTHSLYGWEENGCNWLQVSQQILSAVCVTISSGRFSNNPWTLHPLWICAVGLIDFCYSVNKTSLPKTGQYLYFKHMTS